MKSTCLSLMGILSLLTLVGCGTGTVATFDVKVTSNGGAVSGAEVLCEPAESGKGAVFGITREDGICVFDWGARKGVDPGRFKFSVTRYETADGKALPGGEEGQAMKLGGKAIQKVYVFYHDLKAGRGTFDLALESAAEQLDAAN